MFFILLVICMVTVLLLAELKRQQLSKIVKHIPGPREIPFIGSDYMLKNDDITDFQNIDSAECTSPIMKIFIGPKLVLLVSEPTAMQQLLTACQEKPYLINFFNLPYGLFSAKYHIWKPLRKGVSPAFSQRISTSFIPMFEKNYLQLVNSFKNHLGTYDFNFHGVVQRQSFYLTLETTLNSNLKDESIDLHSFEEIEDIISDRTFKRHLHLNIVYQQTKLYRREREIVGLIEKMIDSILAEKSFPINDAATEIKKDFQLTEQSNSHIFIDQLLHLTQDGRYLTPLEIRQNVIAIIFAGYETTAVTITYAILLLAMHPKIEQKVVDELQQWYKKGDTITYDMLKQLSYMELVIKETMRLFPSVPLTIRESIEPLTLSGVGDLPKDVMFVCSFYRMHRWESIWGADADQFRPSRFEPEECAKRHPYCYMPFGAGSRNCLGNRYAMLSIKTGLICLLTEYRFSTRLRLEDVKLKFSITLKLLNKNILKVEKRE